MEAEYLKSSIDTWLEEYFKEKGTYNKIIFDAMGYSINIGGKRIRPILLLLTYKMYKEDYQEVMPIAAAIEMIHTYSLIHDDLPCMDNDDLRRGKPTNHKVFGEAVAVLAGDGLLNEAMDVMFKYCINKKPCVLKACSIITNASGSCGMIAGQVVDILSENKKISKDELHYMHEKKTGELIKAPIVAGAILAEASDNDIDTLRAFGEKLGLAFQIKDDILDIIGDTKKLGKSTKSDEKDNKSTFVTYYGLEECKNMCCTLTEECFELLDKIDKDTTELKTLTMFLLKRDF